MVSCVFKYYAWLNQCSLNVLSVHAGLCVSYAVVSA